MALFFLSVRHYTLTEKGFGIGNIFRECLKPEFISNDNIINDTSGSHSYYNAVVA